MPRYIDTEDFKHLINASSLYDTEEWVKVMNLLADTPTADVHENVHAKWVIEKEIVNGVLHDCQFCSNCDYPQYLTTKFCPNCGAQMDERSEDE